MKTTIKKLLALGLALSMAFVSPLQSLAYDQSPSEQLQTLAIKLTAYKDGYAYYMADITNDAEEELLVTKASGKYQNLTVYFCDYDKNKTGKAGTVKKVTSMWLSPKNTLIVSTHGTPSDTYTEYTIAKKKLKAKTSYSVKKVKNASGKKVTRYYKNKKAITKSVYNKFVKTVKKKYQSIVTLPAANRWIDSAIFGWAEAAGNVGLKNDYFLASNYDFLSVDRLGDDKYDVGPATDAMERTHQDVLDILTGVKGTGADAKKAQDYFEKKIDWAKRDKLGTRPLEKYLDRIDEISSLSQLTTYLTTTSEVRLSDLVGFEVLSGFSDSGKYDVVLEPNGVLDETISFIGTDVLTRTGFSAKRIDSILSNATEIEAALTQNYRTDEEIGNDFMSTGSLGRVIDYSELSTEYKVFPIKDYLKSFGITGGKVILYQEEQAENLDAIYNEANLEKLKDYLILYTAGSIADRLDSQEYTFVKNAQPDNALGYVFPEEFEDQLDEAVDQMYDGASEFFVGGLVQNAYASQTIAPKDKAALKSCVDEIITEYRKMLSEEEWLSEATRKKAIEKLDALNVNCLYPDTLPDMSYIQVNASDNYLDTYAKTRTQTLKNWGASAGKVMGRSDWRWDLDPSMGTTEMNAMYDPGVNKAYICGGIAELVDDLSNAGKEVIMANLGFVIGHEITHAFDNTGANYDKDGNFAVTEATPYGWWTQEDSLAFGEKVAKVIDYYDHMYLIPGFNFSGELYAGEAIADMGSMAVLLRIAEKTPGFNYEKFFSSYVSGFYMNQIILIYEGLYAVLDEHPLGYLRSNVVLQQFDKFYEVYGVSKGDGMYLAPEDRIAIW